jgi:hypothetical protein
LCFNQVNTWYEEKLSWKDYRELFVVIPCYGAVALLTIWYIPSLTNETNSRVQSYALTIGEDSTTYKVGDGKLTFTLNNNQGATSSLYIYGLLLANNINQAKFFVSDLYSQGGTSVKASDILVDPNTISLGPISESPTKVDLTVQNSKELGKFQGWFMLLIGEEVISVPLTASTDPLVLIALLWATTGALISIGTWEIANFFDRLRTNRQFGQLTSFSPADQQSINQKKVKLDAHLANSREATQFTLVNFFTVIFGIAAFYLALLSNPDVMELQTISQFDIYSLIGLGLGIGSLSGFINKP